MSFDSVRQIDDAGLDFRPVASVRRGVADIEAGTRLTFVAGEDDFDAYLAAVVRLEPSEMTVSRAFPVYGAGFADSGAALPPPVTFMLLRYTHEPADHVTICLPDRLPHGLSLDAALARITGALGVPALHWRAPAGKAA